MSYRLHQTRLRRKLFGAVIAFAFCLAAIVRPSAAESTESPFSNWLTNREHSTYFPIAVWLQDPKNADRYKAAGINLYVGLWRGPTSNQLAVLQNAGMQVICGQNSYALAHKDNPTIAAWMHGDEPDNAQSRGPGKGYGPPIAPAKIVAEYKQMRKADPSRPILLNLGQSVAWDNYIGRGVRRNHPEDYPEYIEGCDIVSFDIYPVVHESPEIRGKLEYVARGVERLREWSKGDKLVWNCIECTHIGNPETKASPEQVRSEVWMSLIHGSQGLIYFVHEFKPMFKEQALLSDPAMLEAVTRINKQVQDLAPVLNSSTVANLISVSENTSDVPIATMVKKHAGKTYLFAAAMRDASVSARFSLEKLPGLETAKVIGEDRSIDLHGKKELEDSFAPYGVHLYLLQ